MEANLLIEKIREFARLDGNSIHKPCYNFCECESYSGGCDRDNNYQPNIFQRALNSLGVALPTQHHTICMENTRITDLLDYMRVETTTLQKRWLHMVEIEQDAGCNLADSVKTADIFFPL